jgi:predicted DNA-binding protein (UPF0251 family)
MSSIEEEDEEDWIYYNLRLEDQEELEADEAAQMLEIQIEVSDEIVLSEEK